MQVAKSPEALTEEVVQSNCFEQRAANCQHQVETSASACNTDKKSNQQCTTFLLNTTMSD